MTATKIMIVAGAMFGMLIFAAHEDQADAMRKCQERYSFDTCFQIINR